MSIHADAFVHESAYVDDGAPIGAGTKIWHFCHVLGGAVIGERCSLGQNVVVMNGTRIGNNVKIQNNVSIYEGVELEDDVFCGPSMVFTNVMNPRSHVSRKNEYQTHARAARRDDRRQRDDRVRRDARRVRVRRRGRGGRRRDVRGLRADGRRAGAAHRLDVPVRRAAADSGEGTCAVVRVDVRAGRRRHPPHRRLAGERAAGDRHRRPVRVALVGCGRISRNHFEAIAHIDDLELVAVCDSDASRAQAVGAEQGVPSFASLDEMLADVPSDVVAICTPSGLHPQHGIVAARAGSHVLTEKPMAISLAAADELVQACDDAGVHLFVVKQNRLNPAIQLLKRAVDKGRFGRIYIGQHHRALDAAAGVLRPGAVARDVGVRRRRVHEPGVALRRPDAVARGTGRERDGQDGHAGAADRDRGLGRRAC